MWRRLIGLVALILPAPAVAQTPASPMVQVALETSAGRIVVEVRGRPRFLVRETAGVVAGPKRRARPSDVRAGA